jgi:hypothetical protein
VGRRRYEEALVQDKRSRALDPMVEIVEDTRGNVLRDLNRDQESRGRIPEQGEASRSAHGGACRDICEDGETRRGPAVIHAVEERAKQQWVEPTFIASTYAAIGDKDTAMRWLERAFAEKTFAVRSFTSWIHPWLRPLWTDARYQALRRRAMTTTFR